MASSRCTLLVAVLLGLASAACASSLRVSTAGAELTEDSALLAAKLDGPPATAFCSSPQFKSLKCGWASPEELTATTKNQRSQMFTTIFGKMAPMIPATIDAPADASKTVVWEPKAVSLACKGDVKVRHVYKYLSLPKPAVALKTPTDVPPTIINEEGKYVRCALTLPAGPGSEESRALRAKEGPCWLCQDKIGSPPSCPIEAGKWYSTTEVLKADGCAFDRSKGYAALEIGVSIAHGAKMRLAGFEACGAPPCFDSAYETAKRKAATDCDRTKCVAA